MTQRINFFQKGGGIVQALSKIKPYLAQSPVDQNLLHLIYYRVSQINGCAFCLDMHSKDLLAAGEDVQRLLVLDAWREAPFYSDRERAALAWAEATTSLENGAVPDATYEDLKQHFTEQEILDLTFGITTINTYNRLNIAFGAPAGSYKVGQFA